MYLGVSGQTLNLIVPRHNTSVVSGSLFFRGISYIGTLCWFETSWIVRKISNSLFKYWLWYLLCFLILCVKILFLFLFSFIFDLFFIFVPILRNSDFHLFLSHCHKFIYLLFKLILGFRGQLESGWLLGTVMWIRVSNYYKK